MLLVRADTRQGMDLPESMAKNPICPGDEGGEEVHDPRKGALIDKLFIFGALLSSLTIWEEQIG